MRFPYLHANFFFLDFPYSKSTTYKFLFINIENLILHVTPYKFIYNDLTRDQIDF